VRRTPMHRRRRKLLGALAAWCLAPTLVASSLAAPALLASALVAPAMSEPGYPKRPVTIVLPYGAGGLADVCVRLFAQKLSARLGQQFVVDNRPGGAGGIAAKAVLAAPADGYSLFFSGSGMAISMSLFKSRPVDIVRDFTHVSTMATLDELLLATGANSPLKNVVDFVTAARANPGKHAIGTINPGSTQNLTAHRFRQTTGIDVTIIPYKTVPELVTALIRGDVDVGIDYYAGFQPVSGDTRIRIIATTGAGRSPLLPQVPTLTESGFQDFVVTSWQGLSAPKGIPDDVLKRLNGEIVAASADPELREKLSMFGMTPRGSTVEEMTTMMEREVTKWAEVIARGNLAIQ
jgi:tripartite-type tricarboxylate transporter receptor subunit TctC